MANVKTAISLPETLFEKVEDLVGELQISRSRLFVLAVEEFIQRYENQQLLERINAAYDDAPEPDERTLLTAMKQKQKYLVEDEW
jgi:metal-responsive CopG/Arc/MetJ family transcriptional regulator